MKVNLEKISTSMKKIKYDTDIFNFQDQVQKLFQVDDLSLIDDNVEVFAIKCFINGYEKKRR